MSTVLHDATTIFVRQSLPTLRQPFALIFGMLQPLVFLALFGPLLQGTGEVPGMGTGSAGEPVWQWFVPSVLIMLALFGTTGTGYQMLTEIETGSHERLMVTPLNRPAMLIGRTLHDVATLLAQGIIIVAVMIPFGFRTPVVGGLVAFTLLATLGVAMGSLSHALAIACRGAQETFYMVQSSLLFPLLFLSGLMLPLDNAPAWMRAVSTANPLTYVVDALRALFDGEVLTGDVLAGSVACGGLATVGLVLGTRAMRGAA